MIYNEENLNVVSKIITENLTSDLISKKWLQKNLGNKTFGHCHTASGCLYKIFGSDSMHMYRGLDDEGIWHWWVKDIDGKIIDLTKDQYYSIGKIPPYTKEEKVGMLGFEYKKRVEILYGRVMAKLNNRNIGINNFMNNIS